MSSTRAHYWSGEQGWVQPVCLEGVVSVISGRQVGFTTVRAMKYASQYCCDKIIDDEMTIYHECCFPNCTKLWSIRLLSQVVGGEIATLDLPLVQSLWFFQFKHPYSRNVSNVQNVIHCWQQHLFCIELLLGPYWSHRHSSAVRLRTLYSLFKQPGQHKNSEKHVSITA